MSLYRASLILSLYVSSVLHRILVLERARVLSHVALRLRQNRGTYRSTRRMATFFFFPSPRTGHVCLILAVSPDRTISAPLPKGVGKTIARPLPIMLAVQRFLSNNRKAVSKLCRNLALFCLTTAIPLPKMLKLVISAFFCLTIATPPANFDTPSVFC